MEEIARFLAAHPPFSQLPFPEVLRVAGVTQIEYFAANHDILVHGGAQSDFLYVIRRGSVDLLREDASGIQIFDTLGEGEAFGYPSLIRNRPPIVTARTRTETLAYLIPAATFHQLRHNHPAFAQFFAGSAIERLGYALQARDEAAAPALFQTRLRALLRRPVITVPPYTSVRQAARIMRDQNISCLVIETDPASIVTDRDLRNRVLALGLSDEIHVARIMTTPALTLPADSLVFEGLMLMLQNGFHHLPITDDGYVIGVITHSDILIQQSRSPAFLPRQIERARSIAELRAYADQVAETVSALLDAGARVSDIGRMVALAHDALLERLLHDAEQELGEPPCPYAWLVLGSEGRYEQTLRTDQDNALVYADKAPRRAEEYFSTLAERVVGQLVECGFPRCPGNVMATNPEWRQPLQVWQHYFRSWITTPEEEALLRVAIFFDFRRVYGALDVEEGLRPIIARAPETRVFLGRLARAALRQHAPLNFFRQIVAERKGDQRDLIDLKYRGTAMIVDLARLFALEAGVTTTSTLARLRAAAGKSTLSESGAEELSAAFELLSLLRLRHQQQQLHRDEELTNLVSIGQLSALERRELKESLRAIESAQRSVAFTFQTNRIA